MQAGPLDKRVILQRPIEVRGADYADPQITWEDMATVWAAIEPLVGREYFANRETQGETTHRVRLRFRAGVSPKWRVLYGARALEILSVINRNEAGVELELLCAERIDG